MQLMNALFAADCFPIPRVMYSYEFSIVAPYMAIAGSYFFYRNRELVESPLSNFFKSGYQLDALYDAMFITPFRKASYWVKDILDGIAVDGLALGFGDVGKAVGESMVVFQSGKLGTYLSYMFGGVAVLVWIVFTLKGI